MAWQVNYHAEPGLVEVVYSGLVPPAELGAAAQAAVALAKRRKVRLFLTDLSRLQGGHTVFDLYALAETLPGLGVPVGSREAVLAPGLVQGVVDADFWETVCRNRGYEVRSFDDASAALGWLREGLAAQSRPAPPVATASPSG